MYWKKAKHCTPQFSIIFGFTCCFLVLFLSGQKALLVLLLSGDFGDFGDDDLIFGSLDRKLLICLSLREWVEVDSKSLGRVGLVGGEHNAPGAPTLGLRVGSLLLELDLILCPLESSLAPLGVDPELWALIRGLWLRWSSLCRGWEGPWPGELSARSLWGIGRLLWKWKCPGSSGR